MHALGLDVALGMLRRYGDAPPEWRPAAERLLREVRGGRFDRLRLGDDDPGHNVKAVMMFSYEALKAAAQSRFRRLGAFAPEADFTTEAVAVVWGCDAGAGFRDADRFRQRRAAGAQRAASGGSMGCCAPSAWRCCATRGRRMLPRRRTPAPTPMRCASSEDAQRYYEMLPALPQLRHAFEWALANDLDLALDIAAELRQPAKAVRAGPRRRRLVRAGAGGQPGAGYARDARARLGASRQPAERDGGVAWGRSAGPLAGGAGGV